MLWLLAVSLLSFFSGGKAEPQYLLSIPVVMKSNEPATACLDFVRLNESLDVSCILEYFEQNITIFNEQIPATDKLLKCVTFQVPVAKSAVPVFFTLTANGPTTQFSERRSLVIDPVGNIMKIQTDKQIYKPGDVVRGRLISLNNKLRPVYVKVTSLYLLDPSSNRMFQLLNLVSVQGVVSFEFPLLSSAALGTYRIEAQTESAETVSKSFSLEEYVSPRFAIVLNAPSAVTVLDEVLPYNMSSRYTYGLGVPGKVTSRLCRRYFSYYPGNNCNRNPEGICQTSTGQMDSDGSYGGIFDLSEFQLNRPGLEMVFHLQVTISEEGTAVQATESRNIYISSEISRVTFDRQVMQRYFKPMMPYHVRMHVFNAAGQPLGNQTVALQVAGTIAQNLTTAEDGSAECNLDTSAFLESEMSIQAVFKQTEQCYDSNWLTPTFSNDYFTVTRFYSRTLSYMQAQAPSEELLCGKTYDIKVQYALSKEGVGEGNAAASLTYLILSKASIVQHGHQELDLSSSLNGEVSFGLVVSPDLAPVCDVLMYIILSEEIIADTKRINTEKCFEHQVSMNFSAEEAIPGSTVDLTVSAAPSSLCGLLVTDSSMLILSEKQDITPESIYNALRYTTLTGYYAAGFNVAPLSPPCVDPKNFLFLKGLYYQVMSYSNEGDAYQVFQDIGLMVATNSTVHKPEVCGRSGIFSTPAFTTSFGRPVASFAREENFSGSSAASPVITVRDQFPDVWVFSLESLGDNGTTSIPATVPGTITQWQFSGFCMSDEKGFGITKHASNLTAFLPFFVESSTPYSIMTNEVLVVKAFVQNSLIKCIKIGIELGTSEDFSAEMTEGQQEICICHKERASYSWNLIAEKKGVISINVTAWTIFIGDTCDGASDPSQPFRMDSYIDLLIVEAEGIENEITFSSLVTLEGASVHIPISFTPPSNIVAGSLQSSVVVIGDVLGLSAANLQSLIRLPTGCGEQTLATLMPIPHVLKYLNCTGQLTDDLKAQAIGYMEIGYRKQLVYINSDGSSNVFGRPYSADSTWLTIMRYAALESIKPYVFIDESLQSRALLIIERTQDRQTGCFHAAGVCFNDDLRGAADGHIGFTAYVTIALLQSSYPGGITLLRGALNCMDAASKTNQSIFNVAIMALAFRMAGYEPQANEMIRQLKEQAIEEDGTIHWQRENKPQPKNVPFFYPPASSSEVEITGYALLAFTHGANPSQAELSYMAPIARWLARQMNPHGGGRSTADTVVALQALSAYGCLVPTGNTTQEVTLSYGNEVLQTFNIDQSSRLLLQTHTLDNNVTEYSIDVTGTGSCFIQAKTIYNMPVSEENAAFTLNVNTSSESCDNGVAYTYTISIATSFQGSQKQSNMAVMDIKMTSGYKPDELSLRKLRDKVSKVEVEGNHVLVYLLSVSRDTIHLSFDVEMQGRVLNSQPQTLYIYDYYELSLYGRAVLYHPCAA